MDESHKKPKTKKPRGKKPTAEKKPREKKTKISQKSIQNVVIHLDGVAKKRGRGRPRKTKVPTPDESGAIGVIPPTVVYQTGYGNFRPGISGTFELGQGVTAVHGGTIAKPASAAVVPPAFEDVGAIGTEGFGEILTKPTKQETLDILGDVVPLEPSSEKKRKPRKQKSSKAAMEEYAASADEPPMAAAVSEPFAAAASEPEPISAGLEEVNPNFIRYTAEDIARINRERTTLAEELGITPQLLPEGTTGRLGSGILGQTVKVVKKKG